MIGKITEKELSSNFKEKINSLESELSSQSPKPLTLNHGVNIVESETNTIINMPYIKGRTVVNYAPLFDSGLWIWNSIFTATSSRKLEGTTSTTGQGTTLMLSNLKQNTTYTVSIKGVNSKIRVRDEAGNYIVDSIDQQILTFNTGTHSVVDIVLSSVVAGYTTIEDVMLNEGTEPKEFVRGFQPIRNPMLTNSSHRSESSMYFLEITLASNEDGSVNDELLPNGAIVKRFDHAVIDGNFEGFVNVSALQNDGVKAIRFNEWALRNNALINNFDGDPSAYLAKYNSLLLAWGSSSLADYFNIGVGSGSNQNNLYIGVSNQDSGWGQNYTPTVDEIKAYFNGWKMYINGGVRQDGYNGTGEKAWYPVTLAFSNVPYDANLRRTVCPVSEIAPQPNWQPYKLQYQLAEPSIEKTNHIGRVQFQEGVNYIEVSEGIVLREKVTPKGNLTYLYIADLNQPDGMFKNKPLKILRVFKNNTDDTHNWYLYNSEINMQGEEKGRIDYVNFDPTATYYVDYIALPYEFTAQVKEAEASYPASMASKVDQHRELIGKLDERLGVNEKRIEEVFTSVGNGKQDLRTAIIEKGGSVVGTHSNSFSELVGGVNSISLGGIDSIQQITRTSTTSGSTIDVDISRIDLNRTVVFFDAGKVRWHGTPTISSMFRAELTNSTNLRFTRGGAGSLVASDLTAYVVQFIHVKSIQRGNFETQLSGGHYVTINPVNLNKSLLLFSYSRSGTLNLDVFMVNGYFSSSNRLYFRNRESVNSTVVHWQVVEFE